MKEKNEKNRKMLKEALGAKENKFIFAVLGLIIALGVIYLAIQAQFKNAAINPGTNEMQLSGENNTIPNTNNNANSGNAVTGTNKSNSNSSNSELNSSPSNENSCKINQVYFIYADWCPHCQKMKPWVQQLEQQGYYFTKINSEDSNALSQAVECLKGIVEFKYIPTFVCISNKQSHVGEFSSIEEMKAFATACNSMQ
jgi:thiol-disulfide isomerase/thioredoxin